MSQAKMIDYVIETASEACAFLESLPFDRPLTSSESGRVVDALRKSLAKAQAVHEITCGQKPEPPAAP